MIKFENPAAFFTLLLIPLLYVLRSVRIFKRISFPLILGDWNGEQFAWNKPFRNFLSFLVRAMCLAGFVLVVFAFANPVVHHQTKVYTSRGSDIFFVVDTSPSMAAKDMAGLTRLEAAKQAVRAVLKENEGDSIGLIEMGREAAVVVVPTMERSVFFSKLDSLSVGGMGDGTAIGMGLSCAALHLEHSSASKKTVVLITDGENNAGEIHPVTASHLLRDKSIALYVVGIGTKGSVPLEYVDPQTGKLYSGYFSSSYDASQLSHIALEAGGKFFDAASLSSLSQALSAVSKNESVLQSYHLKSQNVMLYPKLLLIALILFVSAWLLRRCVLQEVL